MKNYILFVFVVLALASCGKKAQPKPYGYFRIDLPEHEYVEVSDLGPYSIEKAFTATLINRIIHMQQMLMNG